MLAYVALRLGGGLATMLASSVVIFLLVHLVPGDPIAAALGTEFAPEAAASLRELYGLNRPLPEQYGSWLGAVLQGELGVSLLTQVPVDQQLAERIPRTLALLTGGVFVGLVIAVPSAIFAARRRGRAGDAAVAFGTTLLLSVPQFWLGILLITIVAVQLGLLPATGYVEFSSDPLGAVRALILPSLAVGLGMAAFITRTLRSSLLDVLGQDYVRAARARGVAERSVFYVHALKNAAIPALTVVGLEVGYLLGGAIVVEQVFSYPGMGQLIVSSILRRDYPLIQASLLFFTVGFIMVNILVDLAYAALDPRVRAAG